MIEQIEWWRVVLVFFAGMSGGVCIGIELARPRPSQCDHLKEGMSRKGGINRGPSKVVSRPAPPASMNGHAE